MKPFLVVLLLLCASRAHATQSPQFSIGWQCTSYKLLGSGVNCQITPPGWPFFQVNGIPIPTFEVAGAYVPLDPNGLNRNTMRADFPNTFLAVGKNLFHFAAFDSSGDPSGDIIDHVVQLYGLNSNLIANLFSIHIESMDFEGGVTKELSLREIDRHLAEDLGQLEDSITAAYIDLQKTASDNASLAQQLDSFNNLLTDVDSLLLNGFDNISPEALLAVLDKYPLLPPNVAESLVQLMTDLRATIEALKQDIAQLADGFRTQIDGAPILGSQPTPGGFDASHPGSFDSSTNPESIPPVSVPDLLGSDNFDDQHDPYATYADDVLAQLHVATSGNQVTDRDGFINSYEVWRDNERALERALKQRATVSNKEWGAFLRAQQRVFDFASQFVDSNGWFKDAPIPPEIKDLIDGLLALEMLAQSKALKRSLNGWQGSAPTDQQQLILDTLQAFGAGVQSLDDIDAADFPNVYQMFIDLMDGVNAWIKQAVHTVISFTPIGNLISGCEAITGWERCSPSGRRLSDGERVLAGIEVVASSEAFWHRVGRVLKGPAAFLGETLERLFAKLADRKRLKALLLAVEKDHQKLQDLLGVFTANELERVIATVGGDEFKVIIKDLEATELRAFVDKIGTTKLAELAKKFDGTVLKHYGADFFEAFKGITQDTKDHLLQVTVDSISKGAINGVHDKALFLDLLVNQNNGIIENTIVSAKNADVVEYEYRLYKRTGAGTVAQPPTPAAKLSTKTVVNGLSSNWSKWETAANEAIDDALRKKTFPINSTNPRWTGVSSDGIEITGFFRDSFIHTFWPIP